MLAAAVSRSGPAFPAVTNTPRRPAPKKAADNHRRTILRPGCCTRWLKTLTLREKVAQLIVIPFNGHPMNTRSRDYRKFVHLVTQEHVGGLILINVSMAA